LKKRLCAALLAGLMVTASGCFLLPAEEEPPKIALTQEEEETFAFTEVTCGTVRSTFTCRATYSPTAEETLSFPITNVPIAEIYVGIGDAVTEGQLLAELDCEALRTQLDDAIFRRDAAYLELEELGSAYEITMAGLTDSAAREAQTASYNTQRQILLLRMSAEEGRIAEYEEQILERQIYAGMDGVVTFLNHAEVGDTVAAFSTMIIVSDNSSSSFVIGGLDAARFAPGDVVSMQVLEQSFTGTVVEDTQIVGEEDEDMVYIVPEEGLEFGDDARASVTLVEDERENVLCVDNAALRVRSGTAFVYVLDENGLQVMQEVTVGLVGDRTAEILSGLSEGDLVILK